MQRERPAAVLVIAILNFIWGGFGIVGALCFGGGVFLLSAINSSVPPGQPNPVNDMMKLFESIPGYIPFLLFQMALGTVLAVVLIVAGIGLLRMQPWARTACNAYAIITILLTLVGAVYTFTVVNPAMEAWQKENARKLGAAAPPTVPGSNEVGAVCGLVMGIAYSVVLLIVLNTPKVKAAFAGTSSGPPDRLGEDYGDRYGERQQEDDRLRRDEDRLQGG